MRLLIITQKIDKNDDILGFFHRWILEFAKHFEFITVISLQVGEYNLPENVKVFSLGKEKVNTKDSPLSLQRTVLCVSKLKYVFNFYKYIWQQRKNYDAVFVHMNPIYIVLGGLFWRLWKKKIGLWYTHKSVDTKLRIAEGWVNYIFTASDKSFRLKSKKLYIMGHGIDIEQFENRKLEVESKKINILHIGRISRAKNVHLFAKVAEILKQNRIQFQINIVGDAITKEDKKYLKELRDNISNNELTEYFQFVGSISHTKVIEFYYKNDIFINLSDTGSLDKAVLEAMASGIQVLVSNEAFAEILSEENKTTKDPKQIVKDIERIAKTKTNIALREYVIREHNLENLIAKLSKFMK